MAKFLNNICSRDIGYYESRLVRQLIIEPLIWVHGEKRSEAPIGFYSDGASVPRIPIIYSLWGDKVHREAFGHDLWYRKNSVMLIVDPEISIAYPNSHIPKKYIIKKESISKEDADWYFRQTIIEHKTPEYSWFVYQPMYLAVRMCGSSSFHRMNVEDCFKLGE